MSILFVNSNSLATSLRGLGAVYFVLFLHAISLSEKAHAVSNSINHIFSSDQEIQKEIEAIFYRKFNKRVDLLVYHMEYSGYECSKSKEITEFSIFCDSTQPVKSQTNSGQVIWIGFRRSIQIKFFEEQIDVRVTSGVIAP